MELLSGPQSLELNQILKQIQDNFDDALGETGDGYKAMGKTNSRWEGKTIFQNELLQASIINLRGNDRLYIFLQFIPNISLKKIEEENIHKFIDYYFSHTAYREFRTMDCEINQLKVERAISNRLKVLEEYIKFKNNKYTIGTDTFAYKKLKLSWYTKTSIVDKIYNQLTSELIENTDTDCDFQNFTKENNTDKLNFKNKEGGKISIEKNNSKIYISFHNIPFERAEKYYNKIQQLIPRIKEIIVLRSKAGKLISQTKKKLHNTFVEETYKEFFSLISIFETLELMEEKRETDIMLYFLNYIKKDLLDGKIDSASYKSMLNAVESGDISFIIKFFKPVILDLLIKDDPLHQLNGLFHIFSKIFTHFDKEKKLLSKTIIEITKSYIIKKGVDNIDYKKIDKLKKFVETDKDGDFQDKLYNSFVMTDRFLLTNDSLSNCPSPQIDLINYTFFEANIWSEKYSTAFITSLITVLYIQKHKDDFLSLKEIEAPSIKKIKESLGLNNIEMYENLFKKLEQDNPEFILNLITKNIFELIIDNYKDSPTLVRISIISQCKNLWTTADKNTKEHFVKEILHKTIGEHTNDLKAMVRQENSYNSSFPNGQPGDGKNDIDEDFLKKILGNLDIYRPYMKDEYIQHYIDKLTHKQDTKKILR